MDGKRHSFAVAITRSSLYLGEQDNPSRTTSGLTHPSNPDLTGGLIRRSFSRITMLGKRLMPVMRLLPVIRLRPVMRLMPPKRRCAEPGP